MIPLRDTIRSETYPIVNSLIIAANILVFFVELSQQQRLNQFIYVYGLVPARYSVPQVSAYFTTGQQFFSFLTFMFLHGGFLHLLGNMWFLYIFGDNVEDRLGHFRYLVFYLLCGWASGISHLVINWHSEIPTIGASGAIAGVMGAYFILHPRAKVLTLVPIFFFFHFMELPAFLFLGIWFLFQFLSAAGSSAQIGGIAWWAHIGGFETPSDAPGVRCNGKGPRPDKKTHHAPLTGDSSCRFWNRPRPLWCYFDYRTRSLVRGAKTDQHRRGL
jgi:membrane associated rhomboid family serine protease